MDFLIGAYGLEFFWAGLVLIAILLSALTRWESWGWATVTLVALLYGLKALGVFNLIEYGAGHKLALTGWMLGYFAAGIVWAGFCWGNMCSAMMRELLAAEVQYKRNGATQPFNSATQPFRAWLEHNYGYGGQLVELLDGSPQFSDHKERIAVWTYLWPFSIVNRIIGELPIRIYEAVNRALSGLFNRIAADIWNRMWNKSCDAAMQTEEYNKSDKGRSKGV